MEHNLTALFKLSLGVFILFVVGLVAWILLFAKGEDPAIESQAIAIAQEQFVPSEELLALNPRHPAWTYLRVCEKYTNNDDFRGVTYNVDTTDASLSTTRRHFDYCVSLSEKILVAVDSSAEAAEANPLQNPKLGEQPNVTVQSQQSSDPMTDENPGVLTATAFSPTNGWIPDPHNPLVLKLGFAGQKLHATQLAHMTATDGAFDVYASGPSNDDGHASEELLSIVGTSGTGLSLSPPANLYLSKVATPFGAKPEVHVIQIAPQIYGLLVKTSDMAQGVTTSSIDIFGESSGAFHKIFTRETNHDETVQGGNRFDIDIKFGPELKDGWYILHLNGGGVDEDGKTVPPQQICKRQSDTYVCSVS